MDGLLEATEPKVLLEELPTLARFENKLRIGFDMDGILTDFYSAFVQLIKEMHGIDIPDSKPNTWDWCRNYITKKQEDVTWKEVYKGKTFWKDLPICPKASLEDMIRIKELCETDEVFFITNTVSNDLSQAAQQRVDWLTKHFCIAGSKYTLAIMKEKVDYINSISLDFYIDDNPSFLREARGKCKNTIIVKMNWPYNKNIKMLGVDLVTDYIDLVDKVKKLRR